MNDMKFSKRRTMLTLAISIVAVASGINTIAILRTHSALLAIANLVAAAALFALSATLLVAVRREPKLWN